MKEWSSKLNDLRAAILALLTIALLALYVFLVWRVVHLALENLTVIPSRTSEILSTVQGLVSTLVVSVLAVSVPGKPLNLDFMHDAGGEITTAAQWIAILYIFVWLITGAIAFFVGNIYLPTDIADKYKTLIDIGLSWFGIAIASAYAFLGIRPSP